MKEPSLTVMSDDRIGVKICAVLALSETRFCNARLTCTNLIVIMSCDMCNIQVSIHTELHVVVQSVPTVKAQQARQWVEPLSGLLFLS